MVIPMQFAGGSQIGRNHHRVGRNNQDGWTILESDDVVIGVVADGCGTGERSEIGSQIGARIIAESIRLAYIDSKNHDLHWSRIQQHVLSQLDVLARSMSGSYQHVVREFFLFTTIGFVIDQHRAVFFALGDGTIIVNDISTNLGPFPGDAPPYLGYCLIKDRVDIDPTLLHLQVVTEMDVDDLESFLIATDGIGDFINNETVLMPGLKEPVGPLSQFYNEDTYFTNSENVSRKLIRVGRDWPKVNPKFGLLGDDTTLIVGRRNRT